MLCDAYSLPGRFKALLVLAISKYGIIAIFVCYVASGDGIRASIAYIWRFGQTITSFSLKIRTCLVTCRARGTFDTTYNDLSTGICLTALVSVDTEVLGVVKRAFMIPIIKPVKPDLFGYGCRILAKESGNVLERCAFIQGSFYVLTVIKC